MDGGASANDWLMQFQADVLGMPVERPDLVETTALGAAGLAGLALGSGGSTDEFLAGRRFTRFEPEHDAGRARTPSGRAGTGRLPPHWPGPGTVAIIQRYIHRLKPSPGAGMKAGRKFIVGAALIVGSVGFLIAEGVKETGVYFLTPAELAAKTAADPTFVENVGFKLGAKVVPGSVRRDRGARRIDFQVSDGIKTYPVTYHGLVPDTFTDASDIEVVVEGRLGGDGVIRATDVLAKCGSRYEAVPKA